ncbi:MAG: flavodoxin [Bacilli bacterium]|nr:flavodoxin [Bacilli bacterium]
MKSLVIYFSRADENYFGGSMRYIDKGNTEVVAEYIQDITGADLFKAERKIPYSKDYMTCIKEAQDEQRRNELPELVKELSDIDGYDVIFIGGPIYWGTLPQPMFTQLSKLDFNGKTIMPFSTHEGSGLASVVRDIKKYAPKAEVKQGLAIAGSNVRSSKPSLQKWIDEQLS